MKPSNTESIRRGYFNILNYFLSKDTIETRYIRCLIKWGLQIHLKAEDLRLQPEDMDTHGFHLPETKREKAEALYLLVYLIYLDEIVEDIELEVAMVYGKELGFSTGVVDELFSSIATASADGEDPGKIQERVEEFLKLL
jgi:hypothetical protein